jgi:carbon storage regulator
LLSSLDGVLILTRRVGENVIVGDDIVISVIEVRGDAVRIGIQAPRSISVHREEVYLELQRVNEAAATASDAAIGAVIEQLRGGQGPKAADS